MPAVTPADITYSCAELGLHDRCTRPLTCTCTCHHKEAAR